jgi:hypothetical protein
VQVVLVVVVLVETIVIHILEVLEQLTQVVVEVEAVKMAHLLVLEVLVVQESLLLEPRSSFIFCRTSYKYSNYITSPSRRLQSSYIYSIWNANNINLCTFFLIKIIL